MKKLLLINLLLLYVNCISQRLLNLKGVDTVYVEFFGNLNELKINYGGENKKNSRKKYIFESLENKKNVKNLFFVLKINESDSLSILKKTPKTIVVKKSFLKKKRNTIINSKYLKKLNACQIEQMLFGKVLYLIDKTEINKKQKFINLYEGNFALFCNNED